jgi:hypothetical protein
MALDLSDGYTLEAQTPAISDAGYRIPTVTFAYRPAMPKALYDWRYRLRTSMSGHDELAATSKFVAAHLVRWDVTDGKRPAKITAENVSKLPEPVLNFMADKITTWAAYRPPTDGDAEAAPTEKEEAEKNSHTA